MLAAWGPGEWIAVIGATFGVMTYAARMLLMLAEVRNSVRELTCWTEVLAEEFPELQAKVHAKLRGRDSLLALLRMRARGLDVTP